MASTKRTWLWVVLGIAATFFLVRHLLGQQRGEFLLGHAGPLEHTPALQFRRRRNHYHRVAGPLRSCLEEERHVEHNHGGAARLSSREKLIARSLD